MPGWKTAGCTAVCGLGALSFLRIVACEIERTDRVLAQSRDQAAKAYERQQRESAAPDRASSRRASAAPPRNGRKGDFITRSRG